MPRIIKQPPESPALPDLRNLGTILRVLLGVNAAALVIAFAREPRIWALADEWAVLSGYVEPQLFAEVVVLWILAPWLLRLRDAVGVAVVTAVTIAVAFGVPFMMLRLAGQPFTPPVRNLVFALVAQFVLLAYFRLRARALSPAITEARLQALQARIRPHFLFNSLNAVLSLVRSDPRRAEHALENMADLFRALMGNASQLAPLEDEVALTRAYLELEQLRLGDRLQVVWHINKMPADALIPPLVIQPLVENAVYHGIEPLPDGGEISLNVYRSADKVHIVVRNPIAADAGHHKGNRIALANIRERLLLHFDLDAQLKLEPLGAVYQVHIVIPYTRERTQPAPARPHRR